MNHMLLFSSFYTDTRANPSVSGTQLSSLQDVNDLRIHEGASQVCERPVAQCYELRVVILYCLAFLLIIILFFELTVHFFGDSSLLCCTYWPTVCFVSQKGLEFMKIPVSHFFYVRIEGMSCQRQNLILWMSSSTIIPLNSAKIFSFYSNVLFKTYRV